jgi:curved DNA-binding protein CbpA
VSGDATSDLPGLLGEHAAAGSTGILTATRGKLRRLFCFRDGAIVFAASNVIEEQFAELLRTTERLTRAQLESAREQAAANGGKLATAIEAAGLLDAAALTEAMGEQVRTLLDSTLEWVDGEYAFQTGQPELEGEPLTSVAPATRVLEHARHHPAKVDAVRARIGRLGARLEHDETRERLLVDLDLGTAGPYLLAACDGDRKVGEVLDETPADEEDTVRTLYALMRLGLLAPAGTARERAGGRVEVRVTRERLMERIAKADGADHYQVLDVTRSANRATIRAAYYALARRLHPDRFRTGQFSDLREEIEQYFTCVTEAYNTLYDPDRRREYERVLDEGKQKQDESASESDASFLARQNYLRGKALMEKKRLLDAMRFLENAVRLDRTQAEYFLTLGMLQAQNPRFREQAEENLLEVTRIEPAASRAYLALGELYMRGERTAEAEQMFREVLRWSPNNTTAAEKLAELGVKPDRKGLFGS